MATAPWQKIGCPQGLPMPAPSGCYEVGCVDLMHRLEGDSDGLLVRLFYPTDPGLAGQYPYAKLNPHPNYLKAQVESRELWKMEGLTPGSDFDAVADVRGPALHGTPLISSSSENVSLCKLPVIVLSHGYNNIRTSYTALSCELASHGFVLACVEHRDRSACTTVRKIPKPGAPGEYVDKWIPAMYDDDKETGTDTKQQQLLQRVGEVRKVLDLLHLLNEGGEVTNMMGERFDWGQFRGRLQLDTAAVMGHSFGGTTTVKALYTDKRFKCGMVLDCWMTPLSDELMDKPLEQPLLFVNSDLDFQGPTSVKKMLKLVKPANEHGISNCQLMTLKGSNHFHQSDHYFTTPTSKLPKTYSQPPLSPVIGHCENCKVCLDFLKRFVTKNPAYQQHVPSLDGGEEASEHILFGTDVDLENDTDGGEFAELMSLLTTDDDDDDDDEEED